MKNYQAVAHELMVVERAAWWNPRVRRILKAAPLVVMFLLLNTRAARAACSFNPTPDPTADGSSHSLRHAIQMADASGQDCLIQLQAGTYTLTITNTSGQDNTAAQGDLDITDSGHTVTVQGQGAGVSIVNGNGIDRVFQVLGRANAVFRKMTIEGGVAQDDGTAGALPGTRIAEGGGVLVQGGGHVTLSQVSLSGNRAIGGNGRAGTAATVNGTPGEAAEGGGLFLSTGAINLTGSKVSGNAATGGRGGAGFSFNCPTLPCPGHPGPGAGGAGGAGAGGGLYVLSGNETLLKSTVSGNKASGGRAGVGGFFHWSTGSSADTLGGNGGAAQGAGLFVGGGASSLRQTTVSGNSAAGGAGGAFGRPPGASGGSSEGAGMFVASGNISLGNSTLFANTGHGGAGGRDSVNITTIGTEGNAGGGGLYLSSASVSLKGVTVASNRALASQFSFPGSSFGGGIANAGAGLFTNTTLIGNNIQSPSSASNGDDVSGSITSSHSLIGQIAGASITNHGGNIFNVNPELDPNGLQFNGGPTQTVALEDGSPAIDRGDNAICAESPPTGLGKVDQRGIARFRHGDNLCDIGAFEFITLFVRPTFKWFGFEPVGQQTRSQQVSVTNNQTTSVTISKSIGGTNPGAFRIVGTTCGETLAPDTSCTIAIAFKPGAAGKRLALLTVSDSPDRTSPYQVALIGVGQ